VQGLVATALSSASGPPFTGQHELRRSTSGRSLRIAMIRRTHCGRCSGASGVKASIAPIEAWSIRTGPEKASAPCTTRCLTAMTRPMPKWLSRYFPRGLAQQRSGPPPCRRCRRLQPWRRGGPRPAPRLPDAACAAGDQRRLVRNLFHRRSLLLDIAQLALTTPPSQGS
jgi:hypothetical protein